VKAGILLVVVILIFIFVPGFIYADPDTITISGTITLPDGDIAPEGGLGVDLVLNNDTSYYIVGYTIEAGKNSIDFLTTYAANEKNVVLSYKLPEVSSKYVNQSHFSTKGMTGRENATILNTTLTSQKFMLNIQRKKSIEGQITLNSTATANEDIKVYIDVIGANGETDNDSISTEVTIPKGQKDIDYKVLAMPNLVNSGYKLFYTVVGNGAKYYASGYYGEKGVAGYKDAALLDISKGNLSNVDIILNEKTTTVQETLYPIRLKGLWGFMNNVGIITIKPQFEKIGGSFWGETNYDNFQEGVATVQDNKTNQWGYIDTLGNYIGKPEYSYLFNFDGGLGCVLKEKENKIGFMDKNGKVFYIPNGKLYSYNTKVREGRILFQTGEKFGYLDLTGKVVIEPVYDAARDFSEGFATVSKLSKPDAHGTRSLVSMVIDKNGKKVNFPYAEVSSFSDGLATFVSKNGKVGFIDKTGKVVIKPLFDGASNFEGGYARAGIKGKSGLPEDYRTGFIDKKGNIIVKPIYEWASRFSEGLAVVKKGDKYGYVDVNGKEVIKPQFTQANDFSEGMAYVYIGGFEDGYGRCYGGRWCYIDKTGKIVIDRNYFHVAGFKDGIAQVFVYDKVHEYDTFIDLPNVKIGYINKKGEYVMDLTK
jgi:hypothetical protein